MGQACGAGPSWRPLQAAPQGRPGLGVSPGLRAQYRQDQAPSKASQAAAAASAPYVKALSLSPVPHILSAGFRRSGRQALDPCPVSSSGVQQAELSYAQSQLDYTKAARSQVALHQQRSF